MPDHSLYCILLLHYYRFLQYLVSYILNVTVHVLWCSTIMDFWQTARGLNYNMLSQFMPIPPLGIPCLSSSAGSGAVWGALAFLLPFWSILEIHLAHTLIQIKTHNHHHPKSQTSEPVSDYVESQFSSWASASSTRIHLLDFPCCAVGRLRLVARCVGCHGGCVFQTRVTVLWRRINHDTISSIIVSFRHTDMF